MKDRRASFGLIGLLLVCVLFAPIREPHDVQTPAYSQAVTSDSAVVRIATRAKQVLGLRVHRDRRVVRELRDPRPTQRHDFVVDDLEPGAVYTFDVLSRSGRIIERGEFRTRSDDDAARVRFAVVGDSGGQPWWDFARHSPLFHDCGLVDTLAPAWVPSAMGRALAAARPDFWLHVGDVVYPRGEQRHYGTGFFRPFADALRSSTCYPVLGNHDVMVEDGAAFLANFRYAGDNPRCFTFRDGPLRVIGIDLTSPEVRPATAENPSIQYLQQVLAAATEPWIIVVNHFPVRSVYREAPRDDLLSVFMPLCEKHGVDLLLAGHDHNYQRFAVPGSVPEIVTGGGGKSLYDIKYDPPGLVVAAREYHFCVVEIAGDRLEFRAIALDGRELDRFEIVKRAPSEAPVSPRRAARIRALVE